MLLGQCAPNSGVIELSCLVLHICEGQASAMRIFRSPAVGCLGGRFPEGIGGCCKHLVCPVHGRLSSLRLPPARHSVSEVLQMHLKT